MKLLYFAWVRERIGLDEENVDLPSSVKTVSDLLQWLKNRGENYAHALEASDVIRVALDKQHAEPDSPIANIREVALFPPMTGG